MKKKDLPEEQKNNDVEAEEPKLEGNFPWTALIICGVILLLMIGCIITIVCLSK